MTTISTNETQELAGATADEAHDRYLRKLGEQQLSRVANDIVLGTGIPWADAIVEAQKRLGR